MKHHALFALCLLGCSTFAPTYAVYAADASGITQHAVQFPKGGSEATIKSRIKGENVLDYTLIAAKGQHISITLNGASTTYFNLMAPGSTGEALFNGAQDGDSYQGILPAKGRYTVRIYQMGAAKQSSAAHPFTLKVGITGTAAPQTEKASAASGKLPCAQQSGQPMGQCPFSVTRTAPGRPPSPSPCRIIGSAPVFRPRQTVNGRPEPSRWRHDLYLASRERSVPDPRGS
ncbi:hypothetical protein O0544_20460 [Edwardsiella anguillarum]|nr:hypothetical protein [Edwardsiella anguillarum]